MSGATHEAWLAERRTGLGGSDVAAILGLSKWKTPLDVYLDKIGEGSEDPDDEKRRTFARGHAMEPTIVDEYARTLPEGVTIVEYPTVHDGCLLANVDRLIVADGLRSCGLGADLDCRAPQSGAPRVEPASRLASLVGYRNDARDEHAAKQDIVAGKHLVGILECKTSRELTPWEEVPAYYQTQVLHYLGFFPEAQYADVAVWFANDQFKVYRIERDEELISQLRLRCTQWWEAYVMTRTPPPASTLSDVKRLFPRSESVKVEDALGESFGDIQEIKFLKDEIKRLESRVEGLQSRVCERMGVADTLVYQGKVIATYKSRKDSQKTDWKAVASHFNPCEALVLEHTKTVAGGRTFLVK